MDKGPKYDTHIQTNTVLFGKQRGDSHEMIFDNPPMCIQNVCNSNKLKNSNWTCLEACPEKKTRTQTIKGVLENCFNWVYGKQYSPLSLNQSCPLS